MDIRTLLLVLFEKFLFFQVLCEDPKISIDYIRYSDNYKWTKVTPEDQNTIYRKDGDDFTISENTVGVTMVCRSSQPVYWDISMDWQDKFTLIYDMYIIIEREVPIGKFGDKSAYKYSSSLVFHAMHKQLAGNYSCKSTMDKNTEKSTYLYLESVAPPYLVNAGRTLNASVDNKETIVLPCHVYNPDVMVYLFQESIHVGVPFNTSDWIEIPLNNSVKFDPKFGFILKVEELPNIMGTYKCATNVTEDFLQINVFSREKSRKPPVALETKQLEGSAAYYWNATNKHFYCCSNSKDKPPTMGISYCDNKPYCNLQRKVEATAKYNESLTALIHPRARASGNCSFEQLWDDVSYVVTCKGQGINLLAELYSSLRTTNRTNPYNAPSVFDIGYEFDMHEHWDPVQLDKEIMIQVLPVLEYKTEVGEYPTDYSTTTLQFPIPKEVPMENGMAVYYIGETISFFCYTSEYFFSKGVQWAVKTKNGSINIIYNITTPLSPRYSGPGVDNSDFYPYRRDTRRKQILLVITEDMDSVLCYAPLWNSSDWTTATLPFKTKKPVLPKVEGSDLETVYWTLNDTNMVLHCKTSFVHPAPTFTWTKDGSDILTDNTTFTITKGNESTTLQVKFISHEIHGQYVCSATNVAGTANRTFNIFVAERHSLGLIIGGSVSVIVFLGALISFLYWKMRVQKNSLVNLRTNVYNGT